MVFDKDRLLMAFHAVPEVIEAYVRNIPGEFLDKNRSETAWTIREHIYHIAGVQDMLYGRILKIKSEENPVITPYFPENEQQGQDRFESVDQALAHFKLNREKQITLINQLEESDFSKEAMHDVYISYNIPVIINHMIFHEYWHMYRIEELWLTRDEYFSG